MNIADESKGSDGSSFEGAPQPHDFAKRRVGEFKDVGVQTDDVPGLKELIA